MNGAPHLSVSPTPDGVWSVSEPGAQRAVAYFPTQWAAMKHALRVALVKPRCRVALLDANGTVRIARDYERKRGDAGAHP